MKICAVDNNVKFYGKVYTVPNIPLRELSKIESNSYKFIEYAKEKNFDYIIFKNGEQRGLSVLIKNLERKTREVFEVLGYPSGNENLDMNLILKAMKEGTEELVDSKVKQGWCCE